jgi:hypothetical protein
LGTPGILRSLLKIGVRARFPTDVKRQFDTKHGRG